MNDMYALLMYAYDQERLARGWANRPTARPPGRRDRPRRRRRRLDPKTARLRSSWLDLDAHDAAWLASVADEFDATAGTQIGGHRRFAYVVMTGPDAGVLVGAGEPTVTLRGAATVLAMTLGDMDELARRRTGRRPARARVLAPVLHRLARPHAPPSRP